MCGGKKDYQPYNSIFSKIKLKLILCQKIINGVCSILWPSMSPINKNTIKKIAIYRIGNIGDIVCSIPAMIAIRKSFPYAHITLVTSPGKFGIGAKEILRGARFLDEIYEYHPEDISSFGNVLNFLKRLRKEKFDLWINLPLDRQTFKRTLRDMFFVKLTGVKKAVGFKLGLPASPYLKKCLKLPLPNEVERLLNILKEDKIINVYQIQFDFPFTKHTEENCANIIKELGIPEETPWIGIAPFTKQSATQWPLERFLEVAKYLKKRGVILLVFGGKSENKKGEEFAKAVGNGCYNLCGKLSVLESAYMLKKCKFLVTNDSGPMHLAAAVGTRCVAIFSAHNYPGQWDPYGEKHIILRKDVNCSPCYLKECPKGNLCINMIQSSEVIEKVEKLCADLLV